MTASAYWQNLTTTEFAAFERASTVAILPVAAIEQHGPHLPLATDALISRAIVARALEGSRTATLLALPALEIGHSLEHRSFAGTVSLDAGTIIDTWMAAAGSVHAAGFDKLVIFNSHGGQRALVDLVAVRVRAELAIKVARAGYFAFGMPEGLFDPDEVRLGIHGGEVETSLMLSIAPELVHRDRLENFTYRDPSLAGGRLLSYERPVGLGWLSEDLNSAGVVGNAARADADRGQRYLEFLARRLVELCDAMLD